MWLGFFFFLPLMKLVIVSEKKLPSSLGASILDLPSIWVVNLSNPMLFLLEHVKIFGLCELGEKRQQVC